LDEFIHVESYFILVNTPKEASIVTCEQTANSTSEQNGLIQGGSSSIQELKGSFTKISLRYSHRKMIRWPYWTVMSSKDWF